MTEAKRYHLTETGLVEGESLGRLSVVLSSDFDTLQSRLDNTERQRRAEFDAGQAAERLAAELQQRLTAADERVDVLEGLLRMSLVAMRRIYLAGEDRIIELGGDCDSVDAMMESDPAAREIRAALKPAEGGGDE